VSQVITRANNDPWEWKLRLTMRRLLLVVVMCMAALVSATGLAAADKPNGHCGFGFELMTIQETLSLVSEGSPNSPEVLLGALEGYDKNDDDLVCVKDLPDTPGSPSYVRNVVDNTASTRH
jgi:hypothetical protein